MDFTYRLAGADLRSLLMTTGAMVWNLNLSKNKGEEHFYAIAAAAILRPSNELPSSAVATVYHFYTDATMAADGRRNFAIIFVLLIIRSSVCDEQPCELAKIYVQGEDGNQQVLTMKQLEPTQCGAKLVAATAGSRYAAPIPRRRPGPGGRAVSGCNTLELVPRVTLSFDDILVGCGRCARVVPVLYWSLII